MKKYLIIICALATAGITKAQKDSTKQYPVDADTKLISYSKVIEVKNVTKSDLYKRGLAWCNAYYKNPADVVREKDSVAGKIVCKARFKIYDEYNKKTDATKDVGDVAYTLTINFKEGRYKYDLTNINQKQTSYFPAEKWMDKKNQYYAASWDYYLKETDENVKKILADLEKAMQAAPKAKKDEW